MVAGRSEGFVGEAGPSASAPAALALSAVRKAFGRTVALDGVDLAFHPGRVHALVGENGAGKSTLLGIIAGFVLPDPPSELRVAGRPIDLANYTPRSARELGIAVVPQELAAVEPMTVAENIFLGREPRSGPFLDRAAMRRRSTELLERLGAPVKPDTPIERLSVAQLQLVEIAKALADESRFVAFDEPSAVLAGDELERLFAVIRALAEHGVAVAYVSHRLDEIFAHCDTYTVLKDGRVVSGGRVADVSRPEIVRMMVGREVSDSFPARSAAVGPARLDVRGLSVDGKLADIDLTVRAGEIVGVAGLMGSGRTTLAKAIFGAIRVSSGQVRVDDTAGPFRSPRSALRAGIAYLPEDRRREGLASGKPVSTNVSLLSLNALLRKPWPIVSSTAERRLVARLIERFAIRTAADGSDAAGRLSGGNQQKVVLAKWLEAGPRVLILDEPTRGIDVGTKEEIYRTLRALASQGLAVLVISSELIEVIGLSDRIVVLAEGRLAGELPGEAATEEAVMRLATGTHQQGVAA